MTFKDYKAHVSCDLHRYDSSKHEFFKSFLIIPGFRYTFWMRTAYYLKTKNGLFSKMLYALSRIALKRTEHRFGISIPYNTEIGPGFYIGHFGGIVVSPDVKIGRNCNINHGVTIGSTYSGKNPGTPTIGDGVYCGPGSKVIGGIEIGNNVAIGANCVVTCSIPGESVVIGVPGKIISRKGSYDYVVNKV